MSWPEAVYKIVVEGGASLVGTIILLYVFTGFWETILGRPVVKRVEVLSEDLNNTLTEVVAEMRIAAREGKHNSTMLAQWATRISEAVDEFEGDDDE